MNQNKSFIEGVSDEDLKMFAIFGAYESGKNFGTNEKPLRNTSAFLGAIPCAEKAGLKEDTCLRASFIMGYLHTVGA